MAYIILNKNNFFHNLDIIANHTKGIDKIAVVLKDNAYGHGLKEIAQMAKEYGVKKAVVRTTKEAKIIEDFFDYILVLGDYSTAPSDKIRYTVNDISTIKKFAKGTKVELKTDSGMHRNGVHVGELEDAFSKIKEAGLVLEAVFTHHRSADELTGEWFWQKTNFDHIKNISKNLAKKFGFDKLRFHSSNSASLFRHSALGEDMARVGIAIYGCLELPKSLRVDGFKPVLSLYAKKNSQRELSSLQRVGYGGDGMVLENGFVSNYDFGYGDGFLRICANGYKTPQNIPLIGRISMDNSSFLSTEDEILVFDDARVLAKHAKTISYEVLTSLKADIKRVVL